MYKICFYVDAAHLEQVKDAMFASGAGNIGNYSHCCWQTRGTGQFLPQEGSNSFIGDKGQLEKLEEYKVEMVCDNDSIQQVINALIQAHPYEEPAYQAWEVNTF